MLLREKQFTFSVHKLITIILLLVLTVLPDSLLANTLHHSMQVQLDPERSFLDVKNAIQLPGETESVSFALNRNLKLSVEGAELTVVNDSPDRQFRIYQLSRLTENRKVLLKYQGFIGNREKNDLFGMPDVIFNDEMLYLDGGSAWYPRFADYPLFTFDLFVKLPDDWQIISQGAPENSADGVRFQLNKPQDNLYMVGGPFQRFSQKIDVDGRKILLEVYFFNKDKSLADKYLSHSARFITQYSRLIGNYPYDKFAIVENRYQTGYGMPSFTLLGSRVIRLPFILYTSLPHEILHNWWGNGVYIDYRQGNWGEGLTAYMADHYYSEQRGSDREYRRKALEKYANFAANQRDFPLQAFTSRHDQASQAIGYSKSLMLFHMLRRHLGDELFYRNIADFWESFQFKEASFQQLIESLAQNSKLDPQVFLKHWVNRAGAPELMLDEAKLIEVASGYQLNLQLSQVQVGDAYPLELPIRITFEQASETFLQRVSMKDKQLQIKLVFDQRPVRVSIDPDYDIFRLLSQTERPASLGRMFGAQKQILVYPEQASEKERSAWQALATSWQKRYGNVELVSDKSLTEIPAEGATWLLGWNNRLLEKSADRFNTGFQKMTSHRAVNFDKQDFSFNQHALVMLDADTMRQPLGFIGAQQPAVINALARKLPHYNGYGFLVFSKETVENIFKKALPVLNSSLEKVF